MRLFFCCIFLLCCFDCTHARGEQKKSSEAPRITKAEHHYLITYGKFRKKVTTFFHFSEKATAENLRPHIAAFLTFPRSASWEEMLQAPLVKRFCTEKRRKKFVTIFRLKPEATWVELGLRVEELWMQLRAS